MNRQPNLMAAAILAIVAASCTLPNGAPWPNTTKVSPGSAVPAAAPISTPDLALTLQSDKQRFLIGEPVYVALVLTNRSAKPRRIFGELKPTFGATQILIADSGRQRPFVPLSIADTDESALITLDPGRMIGDVFPIFFGAGGWTFTTPGRYQVLAVYQTSTGERRVEEARSNALELEIVATTDGSGEFLIGDLEAGKFLLWQAGDHLEAGRRKLDSLRERWPTSVLAHYARFALAKSLSEPFSNYQKNATRPADCKTAMALLREIDTSLLIRNVQVQVQLARLRCELEARDWNAAVETIARIRSLTEGRVEYARILHRVDEYEAYVKRVT